MKYPDSIENVIKNFYAIKKSAAKTTSELDGKIIDDAVLAQKTSKTVQSAAVQPNIWRIIMRSRMTQYAAAAVIILVIIIGIVELGKPIGASAAFAAAMNNIKQARTFSCTVIFPAEYEDGEEHGTYLSKQKCMFKEPDRERREKLTSPWPRYIGETTITDYSTRQELQLRPVEKTARLRDMSSDYVVDGKTGELKLTKFSTRLRDELLKLSAEAVEMSAKALEDLGSVKLDGQSVRILQSRSDNRVTTVWIDPETSYPVQIELKWINQNRQPFTYTSIQIDTELDDNLFSLEPPEGYTLRVDKSSWPDDKAKIGAKVMRLGLWCVVYAGNNDNQFPGDLADIVRAGIITDEVLKKVLASPDEPDGPPVIRYRQPDRDAERSTEVILFEVFDQWPEDGAVVCFADGHCEIIPNQNRFEELIN